MIEDLGDDDIVNCDASLSSHQSNVLSHQGLCLIQQLDTKSIHTKFKEDPIHDSNRFKQYYNLVTRPGTTRWLRLQKLFEVVSAAVRTSDSQASKVVNVILNEI